ncbi:hypothetical protein GXY_13128 [Novacetimonas hansenii ATCC 23769]|uniref:Uncharacterized protein n=1 Tax=Novacetimonas hansenii ATCC 23769 TaxID=714995 RepID=D5QHJ7_NOVHA|nr:hypothetical protein GXY_13128 [Novacetimonas hansenii ATCC 23769]
MTMHEQALPGARDGNILSLPATENAVDGRTPAPEEITRA